MDDNLDRLTRDMMSKSRLELFDPLLSHKIMIQIAEEARQKMKRKFLLIYTFVSAIILAAGILVVQILKVDTLQLASTFEMSSKIFLTIFSNNFFMLFTIVLLLVAFVNLRRSTS